MAASLLSSIAMTLSPEGRVKSVVRLVCGLLCALAVIAPVLEIDFEEISVGLAAYDQAAQQITEQAEEESKMLERTYIEEECEAYISDKATETGTDVGEVAVTARWDDEALVWYPWEVSLRAGFSQSLAQILETELGIPPERQNWSGDE